MVIPTATKNTMTKRQIEILKLLGYEDTDEGGALLRHATFGYRENRYTKNIDLIWKDDKFDDILSSYTMWVTECAKRGAMSDINNAIWKEYNSQDDS